jgi:glycosyltransferase involved in cell wall biosynthesis
MPEKHTAGREQSTAIPRVGVFDHLSATRGGSQLVVARMVSLLSRDCSVDLIHSGKGYTLAELGEAFGVDLRRAAERIVSDSDRSFSVPGERSLGWYARHGLRYDRWLTEPYDLFVYSGHGVPPVSYADAAVAYCHFPIEARPKVAMGSAPDWQRRSALSRLIRMSAYSYLWRQRMRGYRKILTNSRFTASWIERLWEIHSEVLYPPVSMDGPQGPKRDMIVSLGRFDPRDRKNLGTQLEAFPKFLSQVGESWSWCIVGFCGEGHEERKHVDLLRDRVRGLPVTFVLNADRGTVSRCLGEAKLFWHSRGLATLEEETLPAWRMEHFGIATVEAMMAGCVPLVPASGGQPEIVEHRRSGFLCQDAEALIAHSVELANDDELRARMSNAAAQRSMAFRSDVFDRGFLTDARESLSTGAPDHGRKR